MHFGAEFSSWWAQGQWLRRMTAWLRRGGDARRSPLRTRVSRARVSPSTCKSAVVRLRSTCWRRGWPEGAIDMTEQRRKAWKMRGSHVRPELHVITRGFSRQAQHRWGLRSIGASWPALLVVGTSLEHQEMGWRVSWSGEKVRVRKEKRKKKEKERKEERERGKNVRVFGFLKPEYIPFSGLQNKVLFFTQFDLCFRYSSNYGSNSNFQVQIFKLTN